MAQDFLLDKNGDFPISDSVQNGIYLDSPYGASDSQHVTDLIICEKGYLKQFPTDGFGVFKYLNSESSVQTMERNLRISLDSDGYKAENGAVYPSKDGPKIDQNYISNK